MDVKTAAFVVGSAVAEVVIDRSVSGVVDMCQEKASMDDTYGRLEMARSRLMFALEVSRSCLPIIQMSSLGKQRSMIEGYFKECDLMLLRSKQPPVDQQAQLQGVIAATEAGVAAATEAGVVLPEVAAKTRAAAAELAGELVGPEAAESFFSFFPPMWRYVASSVGITTDQQSLSIADVEKFEKLAEFADQFVNNVLQARADSARLVGGMLDN